MLTYTTRYVRREPDSQNTEQPAGLRASRVADGFVAWREAQASFLSIRLGNLGGSYVIQPPLTPFKPSVLWVNYQVHYTRADPYTSWGLNTLENRARTFPDIRVPAFCRGHCWPKVAVIVTFNTCILVDTDSGSAQVLDLDGFTPL